MFLASSAVNVLALVPSPTPQGNACPASYCSVESQFHPIMLQGITCDDWTMGGNVPDWAAQQSGWFPVINTTSIEMLARYASNRPQSPQWDKGHDLIDALDRVERLSKDSLLSWNGILYAALTEFWRTYRIPLAVRVGELVENRRDSLLTSSEALEMSEYLYFQGMGSSYVPWMNETDHKFVTVTNTNNGGVKKLPSGLDPTSVSFVSKTRTSSSLSEGNFERANDHSERLWILNASAC
ncbi:uncharacterized protein B0I36DRAFT_356321 [Microdochium trichocladiopsis]|uniref:Uncharacterized protein n=1 Tax=Microdochium trichocladiopsis TaxID=1682393 RepID=A0A9P9BHR7_9PEZI|nr:uncharacterized protein B0I36DRAFT_356321 [Microdochium trichocladiopsis]KAH7012244.1 hypothetical protein B0I36DRAFT_356321 [Microdochium trichocladiopsis]